MTLYFIRIVSLLLSSIFTTFVHADSWTAIQSANFGSDVSLAQENSSNASVQGVNSVKLGTTGTITTGSSQAVGLGVNNITLLQSNGTVNSYQFVNGMDAGVISIAGGGVSQLVNDAGTIEMRHIGVGAANTQAINLAKATTVHNLTQRISSVAINFEQSGTGTNNLQAGNLLESDSLSTTSGDVLQEIDLNTVAFQQTGGSSNLQAGNVMLISSSSVAGSLEQTFSANQITSTQSSVSGSLQSATYAGKPLP